MSNYIKWDDIVIRYPSINNVGGASEVGSAWIGAIERQVEGLLAPQYTAPFSSNNETVKDLCIELAYIRIGNLKIEEAKDMREAFMDRIERIKGGSESLMTSSGGAIGQVGDTIWSSTADYHPIFDLGETLDMVVDSSQLESIENAKL
ncbi:hypothetical protein KAR91_47715 [Candidatus Pacearchaeota archaeon]|nr:hypothetical protein [Candidatus Pacearchaeota archaeon]